MNGFTYGRTRCSVHHYEVFWKYVPVGAFIWNFLCSEVADDIKIMEFFLTHEAY